MQRPTAEGGGSAGGAGRRKSSQRANLQHRGHKPRTLHSAPILALWVERRAGFGQAKTRLSLWLVGQEGSCVKELQGSDRDVRLCLKSASASICLCLKSWPPCRAHGQHRPRGTVQSGCPIISLFQQSNSCQYTFAQPGFQHRAMPRCTEVSASVPTPAARCGAPGAGPAAAGCRASPPRQSCGCGAGAEAHCGAGDRWLHMAVGNRSLTAAAAAAGAAA